MALPLVAALVVVVLLSALLSSSLAKKIVKPLNELDFAKPDTKDIYPEIYPLLSKISRQNTLIELQMDDLKKRQKEFLTITQNMSEGLILIDSKAEVLSYNKSARRLLSVKNSEIYESVLSFNSSDEFKFAVSTVLSGEKSRPIIEVEGKTCQIFANPVYVEEAVSGAVLLILDVTEKEQRDAMRREFTSNVSHELKTPMTTIGGFIDGIIDGTIDNSRQEQYLKIVSSEVKRMHRLVEGMLNLSKLEAGETKLKPTNFDFRDLVIDVVLSQEQRIEANKLEIQGLDAMESCIVHADRDLLHQVVYNLCDNGIKYNHSGGKVVVDVQQTPHNTVLRVKDTGIGIPEESRERIFERFYRVDKSRSKEVGGTGLGLSIVKHAVLVHGGKIEVNSEVGKGTEFIVSLPNKPKEIEV
jgi:two-component system phosphate regulon sensor histidine kinase PhoR